MSVNLFFKHTARKELASTSLSRRNHMVIAHGLLGNCNNWNTSSDMLLRREVTLHVEEGKKMLPFVTDIFQVDMRNHGQSPHTPTHHTTLMASDLEAFVMTNPLMNTTPDDRTVMVGHSMGGIATMHSLIRRANTEYYVGGGMVPSTFEEMEIRDTIADCDANERNINQFWTNPVTGRKEERPFCGRVMHHRSSPSSPSSSAPPRVVGAIIVDIPPMQMSKGDKLGSVREIVKVMAGLDLSKIKTTKDGDNALKNAGIKDPNMRMFLLTNLHLDPHGGSAARWKCNIETLHNDLGQIMIPDDDPSLTLGMKKVSDVPVFFVFGSRSEYFKSLPRVEHLIDKYFDRESCPVAIEVMEGCDHYPHYQSPKRYVEVISPFISKVFS